MMTTYCRGVASTMILATLVLSACSNAPASIGEKDPELAKSDLAAYAASWDGYVEAYQFEDTKDRVRLVLDEHGNGSLRFGERDLIGAPTDPAAYYPPQTSARDWGGVDKISTLVFSGFEYSTHSARIESERIRFGATSRELFSDYCALQTSYVDAPRSTPEQPQYKCVPYGSTKFINVNLDDALCTIPASTTSSSWGTGEPTVDVNCEQLSMCSGQGFGCTCAETGCSVDTSISDMSLDAALDDSQQSLDGTLVLLGERLTVRLERQ